MLYQFVSSHQPKYAIELQCRVLGISRSGYYSWCSGKTHKPDEKNKKMEQQVIKIFQEHSRRYGARRIAKTLQSAGETVGRYKAGRVLNKYGLTSFPMPLNIQSISLKRILKSGLIKKIIWWFIM